MVSLYQLCNVLEIKRLAKLAFRHNAILTCYRFEESSGKVKLVGQISDITDKLKAEKEDVQIATRAFKGFIKNRLSDLGLGFVYSDGLVFTPFHVTSEALMHNIAVCRQNPVSANSFSIDPNPSVDLTLADPVFK